MGFAVDAVKGIGKGIGWVADKITDIPVVGDIARVGTNFIPGIGPLVSAGLNAADAYYDGTTGAPQSALGMMAGMGSGMYGMGGGGRGGGGLDLMKILPMIVGGAGSVYGAIQGNKDSSRARELAEQALTTAQSNQQQSQARYDKYLPMYEQGLANWGPSENPFFSNPLAALGGMGQASTRPALPAQPRVSQSAVSAATTGIQGPRSVNIPGWSGADIQAGRDLSPPSGNFWQDYNRLQQQQGWGGYTPPAMQQPTQPQPYQDLNKLFDQSRFPRSPLTMMKGMAV